MAKKLSKKKDILFICGHYEGVDARVQKILKAKKVTVGPYVLTGGELPAATMIDAVSRFVTGVLGKAESLRHPASPVRKSTRAPMCSYGKAKNTKCPKSSNPAIMRK